VCYLLPKVYLRTAGKRLPQNVKQPEKFSVYRIVYSRSKNVKVFDILGIIIGDIFQVGY